MKTIKYIGAADNYTDPVAGYSWDNGQTRIVTDTQWQSLLNAGKFIDATPYQGGEAYVKAVDNPDTWRIEKQSGGVVSLGVLKKMTTAMRYFFHRYSTEANDATGYTYQHVEELPVMPDAVSVILANSQTSGTHEYQVGVALLPSAETDADVIGNSASYAFMNFSESYSGTASVANVPVTGVADYPNWVVSDPIGLAPVERTDGVPGALLALRAFVRTGTATMTRVGSPAVGDNWVDNGAAPVGHRRWVRRMAGQRLATPSTFSASVEVDHSVIAGVIYWHRGTVINVAIFGDSTASGVGAIDGRSYMKLACEDLTAQTGIPFELSNFAQPGGATETYCLKGAGGKTTAGAVIPGALQKFGHLMHVAAVQIGSQNSVTGTIDDTEFGTIKRGLARIFSRISEVNAVPVAVTWPPSNTASDTPSGVTAYAATDSLRRTMNDDYRASGLAVIDTDSALAGVQGGDGQVRIAAGKTTDGTHPNDAANTGELKDLAKAVLRGALVP